VTIFNFNSFFIFLEFSIQTFDEGINFNSCFVREGLFF
jgi:hypothetical protein